VILFVHIPKAAGAHLKAVLDRIYTPEQICHDYDDRIAVPSSPYHTSPVSWRRRTNDLLRTLSPRVEMIYGHFAVTKYFDLLPSARLMTWVREPVARLISMYFFLRTLEDVPGLDHVIQSAAKRVSFAEFVEIPVNQNMMTRLYLHPARADDFEFIGMQEHCEDDLSERGRRLGWPNVPRSSERVNSNPFPGYREAVREIRSDGDLIRRIERMNRADVEFHRECLDLRKRRLRAARHFWFAAAAAQRAA
jgi:hypothetical protein